MSASRKRIDKTLFEAGSQCAKRLYLEANEPANSEPDSDRHALAEVGQKVLELARQAFPHGESIDGSDPAAETEERLASPGPKVLLGARFRTDHVEAETDILVRDRDGSFDVLEVKAGTTIKPRHLFDVALQVHAIEANHGPVRTATILHLDPRYRHDGGVRYPVEKLFRSVDVTNRVRRLLDQIPERVQRYLGQLDDHELTALPTGTWCHHPLPCSYFERCVAEGPEQPLVELPGLTHAQELALHEEGIEDLSGIDRDRAGLTMTQRRALLAIEQSRAIVEPFVREELAKVEFPMCVLHLQWHMEVLPTFEHQRTWQKVPAMWSVQMVAEDGSVEHTSFAAETAEDPRGPCIQGIAELVSRAGALVVFQPEFDKRLRALLEDAPELKNQVQPLLHAPMIELAGLVASGVYAPDFRGSFSLRTVHRGLCGGDYAEGLEIADDRAASAAFRRLRKTRTRATTRAKLGEALRAYGERSSAAILAVFRSLEE